MQVEAYHTIKEIAEAFGLSTQFVTMACKRTTGNTLDCLNAKRTDRGKDFFYIRESKFLEWLEREEQGRVA